MDARVEVKVAKTPYVRFDLNDYSIPHTHVRRTVTVLTSADRVRVLDGATILAEHVRSYDKVVQVEITAHVDALIERKRGARQHRGVSQLTQATRHGEIPGPCCDQGAPPRFHDAGAGTNAGPLRRAGHASGRTRSPAP